MSSSGPWSLPRWYLTRFLRSPLIWDFMYSIILTNSDLLLNLSRSRVQPFQEAEVSSILITTSLGIENKDQNLVRSQVVQLSRMALCNSSNFNYIDDSHILQSWPWESIGDQSQPQLNLKRKQSSLTTLVFPCGGRSSPASCPCWCGSGRSSWSSSCRVFSANLLVDPLFKFDHTRIHPSSRDSLRGSNANPSRVQDQCWRGLIQQISLEHQIFHHDNWPQMSLNSNHLQAI